MARPLVEELFFCGFPYLVIPISTFLSLHLLYCLLYNNVLLKIKQARNPGMVQKRIANSGGRTDGTDGINGIDGTVGTDGADVKIDTDPLQTFYFMVFYVGR